MTIRPVTPQPTARRLPPLPDPPRKSDLQEYIHFDLPAVANTLARHLDALREDATTFIAGRGYLCRQRSDLPSCPYPDMLVSFDVAAADIAQTNGYVISEVGKPPELVLEVASEHTAHRDYINKRVIYAGLGVTEYWRFDHTGGRHYEVALAGDRLTAEGVYRPIELFTESDGVIWGYSEALSLSLCWVERHLRFWDRRQRRYLPDPSELASELDTEREARIAEREARIAERETRITAESRAHDAETRASRLEEELRHLRGE